MRHAPPLLVAVALLAGCGLGDDTDPSTVLADTAASLGEIRSAENLRVSLLVEPAEGDRFGFEVDGPFALCDEDDALPKLDVEYTQIANGQEATVRLVSTGEQGFVVVGADAYELDEEQQGELRAACEDLGGEGGLQRLRVGDWVVDPDASNDDDVDAVSGELDVVAVVNDLVDIARAFGGSRVSRLDRDDARRIAEATEKSSFELETGRDDRLLRRLALEAELGFDVPPDLQASLGDVVGAKVGFELELDGPNERVRVDAPANPRPASELPGG